MKTPKPEALDPLLAASDERIASRRESATDALLRGERAAQVRAAIARLPKKQRATLILRVYHELPHEQIAGILGSSVGAVKANFFHALNNLKKLLKRRIDDTSLPAEFVDLRRRHAGRRAARRTSSVARRAAQQAAALRAMLRDDGGDRGARAVAALLGALSARVRAAVAAEPTPPVRLARGSACAASRVAAAAALIAAVGRRVIAGARGARRPR